MRMKRKKILALMVAAMLCLALLPSYALAVDTAALREPCTVCEAKRTAEYPPTGHTEGEDGKCANCGEHIIQVGDKYYFDLQTAINEAVLSQEVVLLQNIAIENTLYVSSKRTLDLNGKTIKKLNSGRVIKVNGEFTLKDSSEEHTGRLIGGSDENGGGVYVSEYETFHMQGGTIAECSATNEGGGIYVEPLGVLNLSENAVIENCTAGQSGGGIRNKNSKVTITNGTIRGCKAEKFGGGIYAGDGSVGGNLEMTDSTIENCTATQNGGGGIFADMAIVTLTGCTLTGNNANDYGGGIYARLGSNLTMTGCTVQKNIVQNSGGGIFAGGGNAVLTDCYVEENTANASGGGMATNGAAITLEQTEINKNITSGNGGGIYAEKSANILFNSGYINGNKAKEGGGVYLYEGPVFTMSGESNISNNTAASNGGGVMVADVITWYRKDYTNFTMNGGSIVYNEAVGENGDDGYGGGICGRTKTNIYISGGSVGSNQAVNGGGISLLDRASASISGGHFQGNAAKSGNGGGCLINHTSSLKLTGGTISRNTTQKLGAGIYVGGKLVVGENPSVSENYIILEAEEGAEENKSNIYLPAEKTITVADQGLMAMDRGTGEVKPALYVTAENSGAVITGACTEKSSKYFFSDNEDYVAVYEDGVTKLSFGDHTVTFLLNGDEGDIRTVKAADGHPVREIDGDAWGKNGYSFIGWQLNGEDYDFSKPVTSDLTLTPKWISDETPSVSLSYTKFYVNGLINKKAKLYLAAYRSDGELIGVYSQMLEYPLNDSFEAVGMDITGADKLAAFLWDEAMKPLCEKALREFQ